MSEFPPVDPDGSAAVTGGTGAYEGASGRVEVRPAPDHKLYLNYILT